MADEPTASPQASLPADRCARYEQLLHVMRKAFTKTVSQIDMDDLLQRVYQEDAAIFGEDQLRRVMVSVLENMEERVLRDMLQYLHENDIEKKLLVVERLCQNVQAEETAQKRAFQAEKERTQRALRELLPAGVKPMDVANYKMYQKMLQEKEEILRDLDIQQQEIARLEEAQRQMEASVRSKAEMIEKVGGTLDQVAEMGSSTVGMFGALGMDV